MSLLFASLFTFAIAVNPTFVEYGHWILSEATFAASAILSLFLMEKFEENPGDRKRSKFFILAILAMVYTAHIKTVGLVLVIAGVFYLTVKRRWKHLSIFVLLTVMLVSPWMIRNRINYDPKAIGYDKQLLMKNPYSPELGDICVSDFIVRIGKNIKSYSTREIGRAFVGTEMPLGDSMMHKSISMLIFILAITGFISILFKKKFRYLEACMLAYSGVVFIWPDVWSDVRFIMPLIPLILYYSFQGVSWLMELSGLSGSRKPAVLTYILAIALIGISFQLVRVPANINMITRYLKGDKYAGYPVNWVYFFQAADWSKANTPETSVFTVRKPRLWHLKTNRLVRGYPFSIDRDEVYQDAVKSDYVVVDAVSGTTYRYLIPALQEHQDSFAVVFKLDNPLTAVLKVMK